MFFGRFIALLRIFAAFLAGVNRYSWGQFLFYNATGGMIWARDLRPWRLCLRRRFRACRRSVGKIALGLAVLGVAVGWWVIHTQEKKLIARAVAAYPGPLRGREDAADPRVKVEF